MLLKRLGALFGVTMLLCAQFSWEWQPNWELIAPAEFAPEAASPGGPTSSSDSQFLIEGEDLLRNGSFEEDPRGTWVGLQTQGVWLDKDVNMHGRYSLRIDRPGEKGDICFSQRISRSAQGLKPLGRYRLRGYLKSESLPTVASLRVLSGRNLRNVYMGDPLHDFIAGTHDWTQFTIDFTVAAQVPEIAVALCCDKPAPPSLPSGTLWVDCLSLHRLGRATGR